MIEGLDRPSFARTTMRIAIKRIRQLLHHDTRDLLWLAYVVGLASSVHRAARPIHRLRRWQARRRRKRDLATRLELLRVRAGQQRFVSGSYRVALAQLCPALDSICSSLRRPDEEIVLADIDQDGLLVPFNIELVRNNGFRNVSVIERPGSNRRLVIARTR